MLTRCRSLVIAASFLASVACGSSSSDETSAGESAVSSTNPSTLLDLPFYFSVNVDSMTEMTKAERAHPYPTLWNPAKGSAGQTGLRVIAVPKGDQTKMSVPFTQSTILREGDLLVAFRPGLANTLPYAHLQMGATHAGMVRLIDGHANGVDQPLDTDHNAPNANPFSSRHYREVPALHVIRPRAMADARRQANLQTWQAKAQALVGADGRPGFNDNYLNPATAAPVDPTTGTRLPGTTYRDDFANNPKNVAFAIGKGLLSGNVRSVLGIDLNPSTDGEQQLFCSELAYHLLTLSNCTVADIQGSATAPACLDARPFEMLPFAGASEPSGLGEGPLMVAMQEKALLGLLPSVFCPPEDACDVNSPELTSGHRTANAMLLSFHVPQALQAIDGVRGTNANAPLPAATLPVVNMIPNNYSPTSFILETLRPSAERAFDYVATIVFVDPTDYAKAKLLAKNPIPKTDGAN